MKYYLVLGSVVLLVLCFCCFGGNANCCRRFLADPYNVSPFMCSYVDDLIGDGIDTIEALQNINCCVDMNCKFHTAY